MQITFLENGNLVMTPGAADMEELRRTHMPLEAAVTEQWWLTKHGFKVVKPEDIGALTSATCIEYEGNYYGDMNYQVQSLLKMLCQGDAVIWQKG